MSVNTITRNTNLSAFPIRTPPFQNSPSQLIWTWALAKWFQDLDVAVNAAPQILETIPASSSSSGSIGDIAFDTNFLYFCVEADTWRRVALSAF